MPELSELAVHSFEINTGPVYFDVSKTLSAELVEKLRAAFARLEKKGELRKIELRWSE